ncbi:prostaglandin E2 receptor EP3 subtype [Diorhabda carinulata]|uniref:prostaglandin E2 receptor EP3 subtype n=1 Tax=Diorhabda carinulata TaxID=1163345 RepID=UPI0025A2C175|nr:prostaglandin E2 receptor EP3 subtype [Diorhabda carinulata]XP_057659436.1 prostaglandin E2 receptor EP3 subtype [Diorhabda carinulata]XP_057659445.1 prostaglandin E2 receptor EP3 subtype [Diorhabda carinulata]XP_057659454.1 prostaglandin E2 receptor EP3 subtype [Diorhabda carinulata]
MLNTPWSYIIQLAFLIGLIANLAALYILHKTAKRRNKKHLFMLRCLATNDLMAQIGMIILTNKFFYENVHPSIYCPSFVVVRAFGLGSGCVAFVMALERWLALTRPFLYHQLVTHQVLKKFLFGLWITAVTLTYLPLFGFGIYYNSENKTCARFRYATEPKDKAYAYLFFAFGATLCFCIAFCNTSVICELSRIRSQQRILVRRISRSIISSRVGAARYQTPEEVAFAKLMAFVCIIYVVCWAPQVMTVPIAQYFKLTNHEDHKFKKFFIIADAGLTVYLLLDPFIYVLQGYFEGRLHADCCCSKKSDSNLSIPSIMKTQNSDMSVSIPFDVKEPAKPDDEFVHLETMKIT